MTDQTSGRGAGDEPRDEPAADEQVEPETGLVVEGDEIDLDEPADDAEAAELEPEPEPEPEPEATAADDVPVTPPAATAPPREPFDPDPVDDEDVVVPRRDDSDIVIPAHAVSDDDEWDARTASAVPQASDEEPPRRHRWGRYTLLALVALAGAAYVAGFFLTGIRMPADTTIAGVDVSGLRPAEARDTLEAALAPVEDREIVLTHGKQEFTVVPADAGLALDAQRSVDEAGGARSWDPRDMLALVVGRHDHAPVLDVDDAALSSSVAAIGEGVDREVVEAQITFPDGVPTPREPRDGLVVSRSDTEDAIRAAYLVSDDPIEVPTAAVEPTVDADGLAAAMTELAEPAVSGPVTLEVGDTTVELPVSAYAPALSVRVRDDRLALVLDPEELAGPLTDSTTGIGTKAVDASVTITDGKPVVVPGKEGLGLQPEEMATSLVPALTETGAARSVQVEAKVVEPQFTTADAKALKITERISDAETTFPYAEYRNVNQGRAAELIDGTIVKPGETFSFNDVVGERTVANGFTTGTVINGGVFREELGGGVSQVATTTYNAGFFGGMDDTEHHPHAFYISRYPVGREATVYFGSLDLRWKNSTDYGVLIKASVKKSTPSSAGVMRVELWSTKVWDEIEADASPRRNFRTPGTQYDDTDRCVPQAPVQGFDIDIIRKFVKDGKVAKTETDTANYQAADRVVCGKKPKDDD